MSKEAVVNTNNRTLNNISYWARVSLHLVTCGIISWFFCYVMNSALENTNLKIVILNWYWLVLWLIMFLVSLVYLYIENKKKN